MERNFFRRVEIAFPVREATHRERILRDLNLYLADNTQCVDARAAMAPTRVARAATIRCAMRRRALLARYAAGSAPIVVP